MKRKHIYLLFAMLIYTSGIFAQLGIKAGVNMANQIKSFSREDIAAGFNSNNLTGYQIGLVYQAMPKKSGLGVELGALLSQKGSAFQFTDDLTASIIEGYKELNYLEVPLNLRYRISLGIVGVYGFGGLYGGYALNGRTVIETNDETTNETFPELIDRIDYGYNFGAGVEIFNKIQLGATWSQGIKNTVNDQSTNDPTVPTSATNRVFSVNLVYLF